MKILLATYWGVPNEGNAHTYMDLLKIGLESQGHRVDVVSHDTLSQNIYKNRDQDQSIPKSTIRDAISREILIYYETHYEEVENWIVWRDIERYTFELAVAYLTDVRQYDVIHTQDIISTRALSRIMPAHIPLVATIHGSLPEEMRKQGIMKEGAHPTKYLSIEEFFGIVSADKTIVPQRLMWEYQSRFRIKGDQMLTEPYLLDDANHIASNTLNVYSLLKRRK
jgi:glycosyltransferase involved in cell wall biosynthesis